MNDMDYSVLNEIYWKATTLDLTEQCNLACTYCFTWANRRKKLKSMSEETAKKIIDWWLPKGSPIDRHRQLCWWGGEPLLKWDLIVKLKNYTEEQAKRQGWVMEYGGTTNGLLYTPDKVEWCAKNQSMLLVSLDGIQPVHDMCRKTINGEGSWKIVDKNVREALKIFPGQRIRFSLSTKTIEYFLENIKYFVEDLGITNLAFSPVYEDDWNEEYLEVAKEQFDLTIDYMIKRAKDGNEIILKHFNDESNIRCNPDMLNIQNPCGAGNTYSGWSVDGFCFPCHRFNKHGLTTKQRSKLTTTIAGIFNGEIIELNKDWRLQFVKFRENPRQECKECRIWGKSSCNGGCYAVNFDLGGDLHTPPKGLCAFNKIQSDIGLLYHKKAAEFGFVPQRSGWSEDSRQLNGSGKKTCTCFNMCYLQGTPNEIKHIDYNTDITCTCYNTNYNGILDPPNTAAVDHNAERMLSKFLDLSLRILNESDIDKTEEQKELENEVLKKTVWMLEDRKIIK